MPSKQSTPDIRLEFWDIAELSPLSTPSATPAHSRSPSPFDLRQVDFRRYERSWKDTCWILNWVSFRGEVIQIIIVCKNSILYSSSMVSFYVRKGQKFLLDSDQFLIDRLLILSNIFVGILCFDGRGGCFEVWDWLSNSGKHVLLIQSMVTNFSYNFLNSDQFSFQFSQQWTIFISILSTVTNFHFNSLKSY